VNDPYEILGVPRDATREQIVLAYLRLVAADGDVDSGRASEIHDAYELLSDPDRRAEYDAESTPAASPWGFDTPQGDEPAYERYEADDGAERLPLPPPRNPIDRLTRNMPRGTRIALDWIVTIVGAVAIVLAIKAWVINPYRIPSSSMEPTLHCARPGSGCEARFSDRVLANRFIYHFRKPRRGDIIVFKTPPLAEQKCGSGGTFVKRLIGLPGETIQEKAGYMYIDGHKLVEPYIKADRRDTESDILGKTGPYHVPAGDYFFMGDNRIQSCDSREWGPVPRKNLIGEVFAVYWPPNRIGFR
jgi:signal peptidase I